MNAPDSSHAQLQSLGTLGRLSAQSPLPNSSELTVLLAVILSFVLRHFVPTYPANFAPPAAALLALTYIVSGLSQARWPLFILALAQLILEFFQRVPGLPEWPLDLYLIAGGCIVALRRDPRIDLGMRWSFRFSGKELLSASAVILPSIAALTLYFFNHRDVAKAFPLPEVPIRTLPFLIVGAALMNGLREELMYRVILQRTFQAHLSTFWAVLIQALAFGFLHFNNGFPQGWIGVVMTFVFGILTGIQFLWSRSIALVWLTHAATDAAMFSVILAYR